ncbi:MAG: indole-3-glycerol phosphate synthase TrpC [Candidatus Binatia bacterium]|nr:indole-3-glycerol phosphate synthase TrpC [Candidatus Binatia bacterium]
MADRRPDAPDILAKIAAHERRRLADARVRVPVAELQAAPGYSTERRGFAKALAAKRPAVISECKRRSPSKGVLRDPYDPAPIARAYVAAGAAAISVLTNEEFFGGTLDDLRAVREAVEIPVLRKDFTIDPYQLHEARAAGADAVLLIAAILPPDVLLALYTAGRELGLDVLVEVHDEQELEGALRCDAAVLGVNNRDLRTFETDLATTERLVDRVPAGRLLVAESGIRDGADLARLQGSGVQAFLVGEAFMTAEDPGAALGEMLRGATT